MKKIAAVIVIALALAGCGEKDNAIPPKPLSPVAPNAIQVKSVWSLNVGDGSDQQYLLLAPAVQNNILVAVSFDGYVTALNRDTDRAFWHARLPFDIGAAPAVDGAQVIVGGLDGQVNAYNVYSGQLLWQAHVASSVLAAPAIQAGIVVVHAHNGDVAAFDEKTGAKLWLQSNGVPPLTLATDSAPVISGNQVVVGSDNGQLTDYRLKTGVVIWSRPIAIPSGDTEIARMVDVAGTPIIKGGVVYAAAYHGNVVGVRLDNGELLWEKPLSVFNDAALGGGRLFLTDEESNVWALDSQTGRVLWVQKALGWRSLSAPCVVNAHEIAVGDYAGYVHFINTQNGELLARINISGKGITAPPLAVDGLVYTATNDGDLVVLKPSS